MVLELFKDSLSNLLSFFALIKSNGSTNAQMAIQYEIIVPRLEFKVIPPGKTAEHTQNESVKCFLMYI